MSDLFDTITDWLLDQSLDDDSLEVTLSGLAALLIDGGVTIARINIGRTILHPVIGLIETQWERDGVGISVRHIPRAALATPMKQKSPFNDLATGKCKEIFANLKDPDDLNR